MTGFFLVTALHIRPETFDVGTRHETSVDFFGARVPGPTSGTSFHVNISRSGQSDLFQSRHSIVMNADNRNRVILETTTLSFNPFLSVPLQWKGGIGDGSRDRPSGGSRRERMGVDFHMVRPDFARQVEEQNYL